MVYVAINLPNEEKVAAGAALQCAEQGVRVHLLSSMRTRVHIYGLYRHVDMHLTIMCVCSGSPGRCG